MSLISNIQTNNRLGRLMKFYCKRGLTEPNNPENLDPSYKSDKPLSLNWGTKILPYLFVYKMGVSPLQNDYK